MDRTLAGQIVFWQIPRAVSCQLNRAWWVKFGKCKSSLSLILIGAPANQTSIMNSVGNKIRLQQWCANDQFFSMMPFVKPGFSAHKNINKFGTSAQWLP